MEPVTNKLPFASILKRIFNSMTLTKIEKYINFETVHLLSVVVVVGVETTALLCFAGKTQFDLQMESKFDLN